MLRRRSLLWVAGMALGSYACQRDAGAPAPTDTAQGSTSESSAVTGSAVDPTQAPAAPRAVPTDNPGVELRGFGAALRPRFANDQEAKAQVSLPTSADAPFEVASVNDKRFAVRVSQVGTSAAPAKTDKGLVRYAGALGTGTEIMHRPSTSGTEDYVRFEQAPSKAELVYRVELGSSIAGIHEASGDVEFLDADGAPRLRIARPYGIDAAGHEFPAKLSVAGCATDKDARLPWGRPVTAPGATECAVRVTWSDSVAYPAVIDPAWVAGGDMPQPSTTWEALLAPLTGGKAVAVLRSGTNATYVFDPATNTWAAGGNLPFNFDHRDRIVAVGADRAWLVRGSGQTALYNAANNTWTSTAALPNTMNFSEGMGVSYYQGDTVFVTAANGVTASYDLVANAYTAKTANPRNNWGGNFAAVRLDQNSIIVTGFNRADYATYNMATDTWSAKVQTPIQGANCSSIQPLSGGRVLAYGGPGCGGPANWARIYDYVNDTAPVNVVVPAAPIIGCFCARISGVTFGKKHLIAGGRFEFDEDTSTITDLGLPAGYPAGSPVPGAIVKLADGRALAAGASNIDSANRHTNKTALYSPSVQADCPLFGTGATTPVFDNAAKLCKACDGDNGGATALKCPTDAQPVCQAGNGNPLAGSCTECAAGKDAKCTGTKPLCNTTTGACAACERGNGAAGAGRECKTASPVCAGDGSCAKANGDNGTAATATCPTSANPYAKADGTCGKCTASADCAASDGGGPIHAGLVCNSGTGACGNSCFADADCRATEYCVGTGSSGGDAGAGDAGDAGATGTKSCSPKKADGAACAEARECSTGTCTNGSCGVPAVVDAGTDATAPADASADTGTGSSSSSSSSSSSGSASDAGNTNTSGESTGGGGCDCSTGRGDTSSALASLGLVGLVAAIVRRRRRQA